MRTFFRELVDDAFRFMGYVPRRLVKSKIHKLVEAEKATNHNLGLLKQQSRVLELSPKITEVHVIENRVNGKLGFALLIKSYVNERGVAEFAEGSVVQAVEEVTTIGEQELNETNLTLNLSAAEKMVSLLGIGTKHIVIKARN